MKFFNSLDIKNALTGGVLNVFMSWKNNFKVVESLEVKAFSFLLFFFVVFFAIPSYSCSMVSDYAGLCPVGSFQELQREYEVCTRNQEIVRDNDVTASFCTDIYGSTFGVLVSEYIMYGPSYNYECCDEKSQHCNSTRYDVYRCFESEHIPPPPCVNICTGNYMPAGPNCECFCNLPPESIDDCHWPNGDTCQVVNYQFEIDTGVEVNCEEKDSHGRPLVKLILQERKWRPGWTDELYRWDNDISSCMSNQVMGKAIEVWEYGNCGGGAPKPDIYRGTFTYPDQMEMYLGKGKCNYYLKVDWDDPDLWWFNSINFSVECGDCILRDLSEEAPPPVE